MNDNVSNSSSVQIESADHARSEIGRGSVWMIAMRWIMRLIGLVSTVILARLLTPEDFGIVAIAMIMVNFFEIMAHSGQHLAVIRHSEDTRDIYDSAWTFGLIVGGILTVAILCASPLTIVFFEEPRSFVVRIALAFRPLITGLENIGILAFRKELNFRKDFRFGIIRKLSGFVLTVGAAIVLRNHWALVIGVLGGGLLTVVASYWYHPFRPRIGFTRIRELLSFSVHMLSQSVLRFISGKLDEFVTGGVHGTKAMGLYHVGADVGTAPTDELVVPVTRSLLPVYAKLKTDRAALRETYLSSLSMIATLSLSAGIGVAMVAQELVGVVLGDQWHAAGGIIAWLSLAAAATAIADSADGVLNPVGEEALATRLNWVRAILLLPVLPLAGIYGTIDDIALARLGVCVVMVPICLAVVGRYLGIGIAGFAAELWRPALGATTMAAVLYWLDQNMDVPRTWDLLLSVLVGAVTFIVVVMSAWLLCGRPKAFETMTIELAVTFWQRFVRRQADTT